MVAEVTKPDFSYVWSSGGANVLPSAVKIQTGWVAEVPPFQWENAIQNRQDNAIVHLFQKGISEWDATSNYYFTTSGTRSYVQGSDGLIYVAVQDSVGQNPTTDLSDTYWKVAWAAADSGYLTQTTADARYLQRSSNLSDLTNTATARTNLSVYSKVETDALLPTGYFYGFALSNNVTSPNTTLDVGAGQAKTSDNLFSVSLLSSLTGVIQSSGSWVAGNNQNKLDTGVRGNNTTYHVFVIRKTSDGSGDILFSLSATSPTMPTGYSGSRWIHAIRTDSSGNIIGFLSRGDRMYYKSPIRDINLSGQTPGSVSTFSISTPSGIVVEASLYAEIGGDNTAMYVSSPDATDLTPIGFGSTYVGGLSLSAGGGSSLEYTGQQLNVLTNTSNQVRTRYTGQNAVANEIRIVVNGWRVFR